MKAEVVSAALREIADPVIAEHSQRFFKTGPGEYGEGDLFLGIRVPVIRELVKRFAGISRTQIVRLLKSEWHEERLCALLLLVQAYSAGDDAHRQAIYTTYLKHTRYINNWDLVDCSAHLIVGARMLEKGPTDSDRQVLRELALSPDLWRRRIAILATYQFIRRGRFTETLQLSKQLLQDEEDLIHKAVGWMLRELGKRDHKLETQFLDRHYRKMPRTMLRYAIEKYPEDERQAYLKRTV